MAPFTGEPSQTEQIALAIVPKVAGGCSMLGSGYIVYDILRRRQSKGGSYQQKKQTIYHHLMLGLSLCDIVMSFGLFTSTWPMPKDTPYVWGAMGNTASCAVIGFLETSGTSAVLYSGSLSTYYLLRIRNGWTERRLQSVEIWMHLIPLVFGLSTMIAGLPLKLYNSGIFDCWIAPYPLDCDQSWKHPDTSDPQYTPCLRGDNASIYQWAFDIIPKFSSIFLVTINMLLTYWSVREKEIKSQRFSMSAINSNHSSRVSLSQRMARQSYLYVGALYITYIPVAITRMTQLIRGHTYYGMILTIALTIPLQGCWNVLVYLRPRYLKIRDRQREEQHRQIAADPSLGSGTGNSSGLLATGFVVAIRGFSEAVREGELGEDEEENDIDNNDNQHNQDDGSLGEEKEKEEITDVNTDAKD